MKYLTADVYTDGCDCSNGGISSKYKTLMIADIPGPSEENADIPMVKIVKRTIYGNEYMHVEPVTPAPSGSTGYQFGGNFLYACDSRFSAVAAYPIPIHDRVEYS